MHHTRSQWSAYLRCDTAIARTRTTRTLTCDQTRYVREEHVQAWFTERLQARLNGLETDLFADSDSAARLTAQLAADEKRVEKLRTRAEQLIVELADATDSLKPLYRQKLNETAAELDHLSEQVGALRVKLSGMQDATSAQTDLIERIRVEGIDWFWSQSDVWIHQQLAAALGVNRLVCRDGEIIGVIPMPRKSAWRFS